MTLIIKTLTSNTVCKELEGNYSEVGKSITHKIMFHINMFLLNTHVQVN